MQHRAEINQEISRLKASLDSRRKTSRRVPHSVATAYRLVIAQREAHLAQAPDRSLTSPTYATGIGLVLLGFEEENDNTIDKTRENGDDTLRGPKRFLQKIKDFFEDEIPE